MPVTYCARTFSDDELDRIRELAATVPNRRTLSIQVCREFGWLKIDGGLKDMSCRAALLRMQRAGLITLPPSTRTSGPRSHPARGPAPLALPLEAPLRGTRGAIARLTLDPTLSPAESRDWGAIVARYHYLGYAPIPGAQIRYFIHGDGALLGVLGFGASAWKIAPSDNFIGWSPEQRQARLHLVVNNARFVLLPWVTVRFLASSVLGLAARQLARDWSARFAYRPVLMETFVDPARFAGSSYRAANWIRVGQTQGRGKLDPYNRPTKPVKDIYLYPLDSPLPPHPHRAPAPARPRSHPFPPRAGHAAHRIVTSDTGATGPVLSCGGRSRQRTRAGAPGLRWPYGPAESGRMVCVTKGKRSGGEVLGSGGTERTAGWHGSGR